MLLRWTRATVLSLVALTAGSVAHLSADGLMPGPWSLGALLLLGTVASAPLLAEQLSTKRVVVLVMTGQTVVHLALTAMAGHAGERMPVAPAAVPLPQPARGARAGSLYDQLMPPPTATQLRAPDWALHLAHDLSPAHLPMALAHLAAAAVVGLWLASGEQALWAVVRLGISQPIPEPCRVTVLPRLAVLSREAARRKPPVPWSRPRRGPPCALA
jgi:hypothetical protein